MRKVVIVIIFLVVLFIFHTQMEKMDREMCSNDDTHQPYCDE